MAEKPNPLAEEMQRRKDAEEQDKSKKAYDKASPIGESIVKKAKGGSIRGGGCEQRGKTKGRFV